MKDNLLLTLTSLLAILFFSLHWADDMARGFEKGNLSNFGGFLILALWLYAALVLAGRRSGLVLLFIASLMGSVVPILHMRGAGFGGGIAKSAGGFGFIWTLVALGTVSIVALALSVRAWWGLRRASQ